MAYLFDYTGFGEWVNANVLFATAFLVALAGVVGIAVYVLRGDRQNRAGMDDVHPAEEH